MENVRTILLDMPCTVKAYTIFQDDYYTIVLNENLNYEQRHKSYIHELSHIKNADFEKRCSADLIEISAH